MSQRRDLGRQMRRWLSTPIGNGPSQRGDGFRGDGNVILWGVVTETITASVGSLLGKGSVQPLYTEYDDEEDDVTLVGLEDDEGEPIVFLVRNIYSESITVGKRVKFCEVNGYWSLMTSDGC